MPISPGGGCVAAQNAAGGADGHKLVLDVLDAQSKPAGFQEASQTLVQDKGAFGIIAISSSTFGGASYLQKKGIPVTEFAEDGPEWGQQPITNMFSVTGILTGPINGRLYGYNNAEEELKQLA